jgi:hypothetical protein
MNSQFSIGAVGSLPLAALETLSDSLHIILRHARSSCAFAFTQTLFSRAADTTDGCSEHQVDQFRIVGETHAVL